MTGAAASKSDIAFVIVSFNTCDILREALASVERETRNVIAEVWVVDNNSTDGSADMVEAEFPEVRLIRSPINLGFGAANNAALAQARGRYIVLLNSDAFLSPGCIDRAVQHMNEHPQAGLGGARLVGRDGSWQPSARIFPAVWNDAVILLGLSARYPHSRIFGRFDRTWTDQNQPALVDWVPGAFAIIRSEALAKVGFFDPAFFLYSEEVDLCKRMQSAGYQIWYWPDLEVIHIGGESSRQVKSLEMSSSGAQLVLWRMRSMLLYYRKHHGYQAWLARVMELCFYKLVLWRNIFSSEPRRQARRGEARKMAALMQQAWQETRGGRVSPPRPW
jgi:GT2 family glycosyltransferase